MKKLSTGYQYSPSDLITFIHGPFASWMERADCEQIKRFTPDETDESKSLFQKKGYDHEAAALRDLTAELGSKVDLSGVAPADKYRSTVEAMKSGAPLIFQAELRDGEFRGFADFLVRVDKPSQLGAYSYEVWDTKLARNPKSYFGVQLCCYSHMLSVVQGSVPDYFTIILGTNERVRFRIKDYFYYYLSVRNTFITAQKVFNSAAQPIPEKNEDLGRWSDEAAKLLVKLDHLSQIANITTLQCRKLNDAGIASMATLAGASINTCPRTIDRVTFTKLAHQARLQIASRGKPRPLYEVLPHDAQTRIGLAIIPPHSVADIYFDMEGFPLNEGGLEYLFGAICVEDGNRKFKEWWAHDAAEEKRAFVGFIDWAYARWKANPDLHIYHYGAYEVSAMRRLSSRYGTREREVDEFLRANVFVDLYSAVRHGVRIGEPSYSIKNVEKIYGQQRASDVKAAGDSIVEYARWTEEKAGRDHTDSPILRAIHEYNEADCISTQALTDWLRSEMKLAKIEYVPPIAKPNTEEINPADADAEAVPNEARQLVDDLQREIAQIQNSEDQRVLNVLMDSLGYFRREERPQWANLFDKLHYAENELFDDEECLALVTRSSGSPLKIKKSFGYEYTYDTSQPSCLEVGDTVCAYHNTYAEAQIEQLDKINGRLILKVGPKAQPQFESLPNATTFILKSIFSNAILEKAIAEIVAGVRDKLPAVVIPSHLADFLYRRDPNTKAAVRGSRLIEAQHAMPQRASDLAIGMRESVLAIQGPPGSGKTYTGAHVIAALLKAGKKVAVTSQSHKAVNLLLEEAWAVAKNSKTKVQGWKIQSDPEQDGELTEKTGIKNARSSSAFFGKDPEFNLVGGTAFAMAAASAIDQFDYLIVDEAGQFSLAHLIASSRCARNLILLGDQMQLENPIQGSHPGESGKSCLQYLLQDHATIPETLGIFLAETRRLRPEICEFISGAIYEGRLKHHPTAEARSISLSAKAAEVIAKDKGILFYPVYHEGNSQSSVEEAVAIEKLTSGLIGETYTDENGKQHKISLEHILYVTPYNAQRRLLAERLGNSARIGTVDLFQGQEAPIVMLSLCASSGDASPRGLDFLFSKNRLNVALSRAKVLALVVGHPDLQRSRASSLDKMTLVNLFCRLYITGN